MNTIRKKSSHKKPLVVFAFVLVFIAGAALLYSYNKNFWPFSPPSQSTLKTTVSSSPNSKTQSSGQDTTKPSSPTESTGSDSSNTPTPSKTPNQKPTVNMTITSVNESSGILYIRTLIETISSSGTCVINMTGPNGSVYTATVGVQADPSTSTCQGFNIPRSSLSQGSWHVVINYSDSSVQASVSKDIQVQ